MTEDRIRELATLAIHDWDHGMKRIGPAVADAIKRAIAEEREACAAICDAEGDDAGSWYGTSAWMAAEKIRAKGKPE